MLNGYNMELIKELFRKFNISQDSEIILVRKALRELCEKLGFSSLRRTRLVTAFSEISRNMIYHGGGGEIQIHTVSDGERQGILIEFKDNGPGIEDIEKAMEEGFSTVGSLGVGLPGARRLVDDFQIKSQKNVGTEVTLILWKE